MRAAKTLAVSYFSVISWEGEDTGIPAQWTWTRRKCTPYISGCVYDQGVLKDVLPRIALRRWHVVGQVDGIHLSRSKRNIARDFADGGR